MCALLNEDAKKLTAIPEAESAVNVFQEFVGTVGGRNPAPVEVGSLSHFLQGFTNPRWCRISSSMKCRFHQNVCQREFACGD